MSTHHYYNPNLKIFYRPEMCPPDVASFSKSPTKPRRFVEYLRRTELQRYVGIESVFPAATANELMLAHTHRYVQDYIEGVEPRASSSGIQWTREQRDAVFYTNGSLLAAIRAAIKNPRQITMSPTSGFHHATPDRGEGFCTFSGQAIAAIDLWRRKGLRGAWIDMDQHDGNSVRDTAGHTKDITAALPWYVQPFGRGDGYLRSLRLQLDALQPFVFARDVDYICVAHGADSHEWDSLGHSCSTDEWVAAASMVYETIRHWADTLERPIPVTLALFGGYRDDHPDSVLALHAMDAARCLHWLGGVPDLERWTAEVKAR